MSQSETMGHNETKRQVEITPRPTFFRSGQW